MTDKKARELEIRVQMQRQGSLLEVVDMKINKLRERLCEILSQPPEGKVAIGDPIVNGDLCPLAAELRSHNENLEKIEMIIEDLFERIEI